MRARALGALALAGALGLLGSPALAARPESLEGTLEQIRMALATEGNVSWEATAHDAAPPPGGPSDWTYHRRIELSDIAYDSDKCVLGLHYRVLTNGQPSADLPEGVVPLNVVTAVLTPTETALVQARDAKGGRGAVSTSLDPAIYDVELQRSDHHDTVFGFYDASTARHVAELFQRAISLCAAARE